MPTYTNSCVEVPVSEDQPRPDWDRLSEGFNPQPLGLDMKATLNLTFEGSFDAFVTWMQETFKEPSRMPVNVTVRIGGEAEPPKRQPTDPKFNDFQKLTGNGFGYGMDEQRLARGLKEAREAVYRGNKIEAIKIIREYTGCGLKEGKDFVEMHLC